MFKSRANPSYAFRPGVSATSIPDVTCFCASITWMLDARCRSPICEQCCRYEMPIQASNSRHSDSLPCHLWLDMPQAAIADRSSINANPNEEIRIKDSPLCSQQRETWDEWNYNKSTIDNSNIGLRHDIVIVSVADSVCSMLMRHAAVLDQCPSCVMCLACCFRARWTLV